MGLFLPKEKSIAPVIDEKAGKLTHEDTLIYYDKERCGVAVVN